MRTLILLRKAVPNSHPHAEVRAESKLIALLHELGHVQDMQLGLNFDFAAKSTNLIDAEVYAHTYAFQRMAAANYFSAFDRLREAMKEMSSLEDFQGEIARRVLQATASLSPIDIFAELPKLKA